MKNFKYKKVLVTGGAGFIGSHLVKRLLNEGCLVTVIDDLSEGKWENLPKHKNLKKHKASILQDVSSIIRGNEVIFHLAALPRLKRSVDQPKLTHEVNVNGTLNILLAAKEYKVKRFVFASSSSVYGNKNKPPFSENMEPDPLVPYSLHKIIGEEYCKMFSNLWNLQTIILRYFNVYGPGMNPDGSYANLLPKFIKLMSEETSPAINGDGTNTRDFTHVSDVVEANLLAANSNISGEVFNIGYGERVSVNKIVKLLNQVMHKHIDPIYGPSVVEPKTTLANNLKAQKMLKWKPKINLKEGVKTML